MMRAVLILALALGARLDEDECYDITPSCAISGCRVLACGPADDRRIENSIGLAVRCHAVVEPPGRYCYTAYATVTAACGCE